MKIQIICSLTQSTFLELILLQSYKVLCRLQIQQAWKIEIYNVKHFISLPNILTDLRGKEIL